MKTNRIVLSLVACSGLFSCLVLSNPAAAQCLQADIGLQYNLSPNPAQRNNNINFQNNGTCTGNVAITTGVQGYVGGDTSVTQNRTVVNTMNGTVNRTGISMPVMQIQTNVAVDVYNPLPYYPYRYQKQVQTKHQSIKVKSSQESDYLLKVIPDYSSMQFEANLQVNGKEITKMVNDNNLIDLSQYLIPGQNTIEISGSYSPRQSSITFELTGVNTYMSQETGGSGKINQTFTIFVPITNGYSY